jgi:hypothetical protein
MPDIHHNALPGVSTLEGFPSQASNAGKYLTTNGTALSWSSFALTNANIAAGADIDWSKINKTGSSLGDLTTRTTSNLTDFPAQSPSTANEALVSNGSALSWGFPMGCFVLACSDETTNLTTGTARVTFRAPFGFTIPQIPRATLTTASTSGNPSIDINVGGTSVLGANKLSIDANEKTSATAATPTTVATSSVADDAEITIDIDTAGTGARGLKVYLYYVRNA